MNHYLTNFILATALMGCTSSVQQTYQSNYVYSPMPIADTQKDEQPDTHTTAKPITKPIKAVTMTLCPVIADVKAIVLPPLIDYSKVTFRSHREALQAMAAQLADMRRLVREHKELDVKQLGCKPYKVLVE